VRLLKPLSYYQEKYGTPLWGFTKLFLLMEKQHNRGQDGAGVAREARCARPASRSCSASANVKANPLDRIFKDLAQAIQRARRDGVVHPEFAETVKKHFDFGGELYRAPALRHLGGYSLSSCHPYFRRSPWPTRNLMLAGNFNMTNTAELNASLIAMGQHPIFATDTQALLEKIGFFLDEEHEDLYRFLRKREAEGPRAHPPDQRGARRRRGDPPGLAASGTAATPWCGADRQRRRVRARDPSGIRPCLLVPERRGRRVRLRARAADDRVRPEGRPRAEVPPGTSVVIKRSGTVSSRPPFTEPRPRASCSFERIYFSRGNDPDIYRERKALGAGLADQVSAAIDNDWANTVFSFIPNTAEVAYYGLLEALRCAAAARSRPRSSTPRPARAR
jgi:amidophosphoribosyltransferase